MALVYEKEMYVFLHYTPRSFSTSLELYMNS